MSTHIETHPGVGPAPQTEARRDVRQTRARTEPARFLAPLGRFLFVLIFLTAGPANFTSGAIAYAAHARVPFPEIAVPLAGVIALVGALSVLFGFHARGGAWLLVLFLVPVTLLMHAFWSIADPQQAMLQQVMFLKNVAILGGALLLTYFGAGPISLDDRRNSRRAEM
jgi:putative oxidoreductase